MPEDELMPIGTFARRTGLTASALRFYADSGLLSPAEVDPVTGYRFYGGDQVARATTLRRLRELGMPLTSVEAVLTATPEEAARLVDEHVATVLDEAAAVRRRAVAVTSALTGTAPRALPVATLKGPVLADAVEQVLTAAAPIRTGPHADVRAETGVRVETTPDAITLTATDRYRLSTRTLAPTGPERARTWAGTLDGDDLRTAVADLRRSPLVRLEAVPRGLRLRLTDQEDRHCRLLPEEYPDHRLMLASLGEPGTRATLAKERLLRALEGHPDAHVTLRITPTGITLLPPRTTPTPTPTPTLTPTTATAAPTRLPATVSGPPLDIRFAVTTLYPAVSTAIGPDVMLDLRGADRPVTIRSADRGDLTTLAMPTAPACAPTTERDLP